MLQLVKSYVPAIAQVIPDFNRHILDLLQFEGRFQSHPDLSAKWLFEGELLWHEGALTEVYHYHFDL